MDRRDAFADISDEDLRRIQQEPAVDYLPFVSKTDRLQKIFLFDRYEWNRFHADYAVLKLSQGYFTIVDRRDLQKIKRCLTTFTANIQRDRKTQEIVKVYACAKLKGTQTKVYLHRFLCGAEHRGDIVDHVNGLSLDNRRSKNLEETSRSTNSANACYASRSKSGLPRGVYRSKSGTTYFARIRYKGKISFSRQYETPEEAHGWYVKKFKKLHRTGTGKRRFKSFPVFPPKKQEAPSRSVSLAARKAQQAIQDIPF